MQLLRNLFSGLLSPRQEQRPHVVLVAGGARSGKTNLVYRLATLDENWKDSADKYAGVIGYQISEDQMFALDDLRVRTIEVPVHEPGAKVHFDHPFDDLGRQNLLPWFEVTAVVWVVDGAALFGAATADVPRLCYFDGLNAIFAGVPRECPLMIIVNRLDTSAGESSSASQRVADLLAPVLARHCESHHDGHGALGRRPWSVHLAKDGGGRGSLVLPLQWLSRAIRKDTNVRHFTQRLTLPPKA